MQTVWMFPGQGVQYFGMGRALYTRNAVFRTWMTRLDGTASRYVGESIVDILFDDQYTVSDPFDRLLHSHPALFMVQFSAAQALLNEDVPRPDYLLGASLGEFVAAAVADVAAPEEILFDIIKQAHLFEAECTGGAMLMVLDKVDGFATEPLYRGRCELAGINFDNCFVISGRRTDLLDIAVQLAQRNITTQLLPVPAAFHSASVDACKATFLKLFAGHQPTPPQQHIVSCADTQIPDLFGSADYWWQVIRRPIDFRAALCRFDAAHPDALYVDMGPGGNLATNVKYILGQSAAQQRTLALMTPFGGGSEALEQVCARLAANRLYAPADEPHQHSVNS